MTQNILIRSKRNSSVDWNSFFRFLMVLGLLAFGGIYYVSLKHKQYQLGQKIKVVEEMIFEQRKQNEVLLADVTALSSRAELMRKLQSGVIALRPIQDSAIARLWKPSFHDDGGAFHTASLEVRSP